MRSVVRVHLSPLISLKIIEYGGLAQLGERLPCKQEVTSSNLVFSTSAMSTAETDNQNIASCSHVRDILIIGFHRAKARERKSQRLLSAQQCEGGNPGACTRKFVCEEMYVRDTVTEKTEGFRGLRYIERSRKGTNIASCSHKITKARIN